MRSARPGVARSPRRSAASASGLRSVGPAMVSRQSRSSQGAERAHQDVVGLARHDRTDAEQLQRSRRRARCARRGIGAGLGDGDLVGGHREVGDQRPRGDAAGDDDPPCQRQRGRLQRTERVLPRFGQPGLQAQRMVHERDDGRAHARDDLGRHGAVGQPIDHDDVARRYRREQPCRSRRDRPRSDRETIPAAAGGAPRRRTAAAAPARAGRTCSRPSAARCRPEWRRRRGSWRAPTLRAASPPPASKATPSMRRGGRTERHGLSSPIATLDARRRRAS